MLRFSIKASPLFSLKHPQRQGGYLMMELGLVLIVSTILLAASFSKRIDTIDELNASSTADYLKNELQGGINRYIEENIVALKSGNSVAGFPVPLRPTLAQLKATGNYLDSTVANISALGLPFAVQLARQGTCPSGSDCVISGTVYSTVAYKDAGGQVRMDVLSKAFATIGSDAAMSYPEAPAQLRFQGGQTLANPAGNVAGILAIRVGNGSGLTGLLNPYYRLDGSKKLTGPMDANGQDIKGINDLSVNGQAVVNTLNVIGNTKLDAASSPGASCPVEGSLQRNSNGTGLVVCSSGVWQQVGNVVANIGEGVSCSSPGQFGSNSTGISYVCNGSVWSSVNTTAALNSSCAPDGRLAMTVAKEQLVCKNGTYVKLLSLLNKRVEVARVLVTDGTTVAKPSCDAGGTEAYSFQLTQTVVDVSVTPPRQAMYVAAVDNGATWTVKIKVKDNTGAEFTANNYSVSAVMKVECGY